MTVGVVISVQAKANGNLEHSSTTVNRYLFSEADAKGPLKSISKLSNGCVAFIRCACVGLWYLGFRSAQSGHDAVIFFTSSRE